MKKKYWLLAIFLASSLVFASNLGFGIMVGEPTGFTFRSGRFPVVGISWSFSEKINLHVDYWVHNAHLKNNVNWYIGAGGKIFITTADDDDNNFGMGMRIPLGLQFYPVKNLELFAEIAPGVNIIPKTQASFAAGIGLRFYFN